MRYYELLEYDNNKPTMNSMGRPIAFTDQAINNFWNWFGKSKLKDKNGQPLVVFHGTKYDFKSFDPEKANSNTGTGVPHSAFVFTNDSEVSNSYSLEDPDHAVFSSPEIEQQFNKLLKDTSKGSFDRLVDFLDKNPKISSPIYYEGGNTKPVYLKMLKPLIIDAKGYYWNDIYFKPKEYRNPEPFTTNELIEYAMDNGYDSLIVKNVKDRQKGVGKPANTYVVFSPNQIKSAISNTGSYHPDKPEIDETLNEKFLGDVNVRYANGINSDVKVWDISSKNELITLLKKFNGNARALLYKDHLLFWNAREAIHTEIGDAFESYSYNYIELKFSNFNDDKILLESYSKSEPIKNSPHLNKVLKGLSVVIYSEDSPIPSKDSPLYTFGGLKEELIVELFDKTIPYEWNTKHDSQWCAEFKIDDNKYIVYCNGLNHCSINFDIIQKGFGATAGITGTGNAYLVFSTVINIIKDFINQRHPDSFSFESTKHHPSRIKLYRKMVDSLKGQLSNYEFEESEADNPHYKYVTFTFSKINLNEKTEVIEGILKEGRDAPLYHGYPKIEYAIQALQTNAMLGTTTQRWWKNGIERKLDTDSDYDESYWMKGISFSRDINYSLQWGPIVFEFDQAKLANDYKIVPFSWNKSINSAKYGVTVNHKREREEFLILEKEPNSYFKKDEDDGSYHLDATGKPMRDMKAFQAPAKKKLQPLSKYLTGIYISKHFYDVTSMANGYKNEFELFKNHPLFKGFR